jgi:hypothetical protein
VRSVAERVALPAVLAMHIDGWWTASSSGAVMAITSSVTEALDEVDVTAKSIVADIGE